MKFTSKLITNVGKVRAANEDNMGESVTPNGHLFVVCDGMGGHVGGATASSIAVTSIIEFFQREVYDNAIQAIDHALSFANEQIYASALNNPELKGMGTTAVVLLIKNEACFVGHVGDSRIYLYSDAKLNRLTKDHSFVQTLVDSGIISDDEAESHPNKNQILQALGITSSVKGTISPAAILPKVGDTFLLCSDGLNGMVKDGDMQHILSVNNIEIAAENLITAALNAGGTDNITAALVKIEESAHVKSTFSHFNPIPKPDFVSTQQIGGKKATETTKDNKKWLLIGGAMLAVIISFGLYLKFSGDEKLEPKVGLEIDIISKQNIEDCPKLNQSDLLDKKVSDVANDTIEIKDSGDKAVVRDSVVLEILGKPDRKPTGENSDNEEKNKKTKEEKDKSEVKSPKTEPLNKENQRVFKRHKVTKGEGLQAIVKIYKSKCPNLSEESLKEHNLNSSNFAGDKAKLAKEKLMEGWILEIPCD
jgi:serine/threonine protein phosphatase PrpC